MHDQVPEDNEGVRALFAQLDGLGFEAVEDHIDQLLLGIQYDADDRQAQHTVIEALANEDTPEDVIVALVLARMDPTMDVYDISLKLTQIAYSVPELHDQAIQLSEVLHSIWQLSNVVEGAEYKREVQSDILTSDDLTPDTKRFLLAALDELSDEDGIDLNDEDAVNAVFVEVDEEKKHDAETSARKERVSAIVSEAEPQFLERFNIHANDPAWNSARSIGVTHVLISVTHSRNLMLPEALGVNDYLDSLRIPYDDYMAFFKGIIDKVDAAEQS